MNLRNVLRTYALLRSLTDDESALLETLRGLSESDRELMVQELSPSKVVKKSDSKPRVYEHCAQCDKTKGHKFHRDSSEDGYHEFQSVPPEPKKSRRASSLAEKVGGTLASIAKAVGSSDEGARKVINALDAALDYDPNAHCQKEFDGGIVCDEAADANVHHLRGATGYHEFVAGKLNAAQDAARSSSTNGVEKSSSILNSMDETVTAGVAAGGSSE
jgi:hypothetical protein